MARCPVGGERRELDPREVRPVARRPDHGVHVELASVGEADVASRGAHRTRLELDALPLRRARRRSDERVPPLPQSPPDPRIHALVEETYLHEPPEQVTAEQPLW